MAKVRLVLDDPERQASLEALLRENGYEVEIAPVGLEEQLLQRARQLETVAELGQRALASADLGSLMDEAARQAALHLQVDYSLIQETAPHGEALSFSSRIGWLEGHNGMMIEQGPGSLTHLAEVLGEAVVFEDLRAETRFETPELLLAHQVVSGACVLIGSKDKPFGILGVFSRKRRVFNLQEIHFLQAIANILGAAIELQTNEEKYRRLFDLESDALLLLAHENGKILEANNAAVALYNYQRAELLQMCNTDLSAEPDQTLQSVRNRERNIPLRLHRKKDGSIFPVEVTASHFTWHGQAVQLAAVRDITGRLLAEKQIIEVRDFYLQVLQEAPAMIWRSNAEGQCDWYNLTWLQFTGRTFEQEIASNWKALIHPDDLNALIESYRGIYETQKPFQNEYRLLDKDGEYRWIMEVGQPINNQAGQFLGFLGYCFDITERRLSEEDLRRRTDEIRMLYEAGRQLTRTLDLTTIYRTVHQIISQTIDCSGLYVSSFDPADQLIRCVFAIQDGETLDVSGFPPVLLAAQGQGIQSRVIHSGEPMVINDYRAYFKTSHTTYYVTKDGIQEPTAAKDEVTTRSALIVPLKLEGIVRGDIQVFSYRENAFSEENLHFLESLSLQTVAAMHNALLYQRAQVEIAERKQAERSLSQVAAELAERVKELRCLYNTANLLADVQSPLPEMLQQLVEMIPSAMQYGEQARARLTLEQQIYQSADCQQVPMQLASPVYLSRRLAGSLEAGYLVGDHSDQPLTFLPEEAHLLDALARQLGNALERRRADSALRESEYRFRAIFNHHYQLTGLLNLQGRMLAVNPAAQKFSAMSEAELIGKLFWQGPWWAHSTELSEQVRQDVQRAARGALIHHETTHQDAIGKLHYIDFSINPILDDQGQVLYLMPEGRDITESKEAEQTLQQLNRRMSALVEVGLALSQTLALERVYQIACEHVARFVDCPNFGISLYNPVSRTLRMEYAVSDGQVLDTQLFPELAFDEHTPLRGRSRALATAQPELMTGLRAIQEAMVVMAGDDRAPDSALYVPMLVRGQVMGLVEVQSYEADAYNADQITLLGLVAHQIGMAIENARLYQQVSRELNERRQTEQALRESEQRYRLLAENVEDVIWVRDASLQQYTYFSPSIERLLGYTPDEMLTKPLEAFMESTSFQVVQAAAERRLQMESEGESGDEARRFETEWIRKDGVKLWVESATRPLRAPDGEFLGLVGISRDITQRKLAEEQVRASLAEKEVLLREIHHRVKNNLEVIISLADLQARTITDAQALQNIRELQERVRTIALVHEDLYRSSNLASIRAEAYIRKLTDNLFQVFGSGGIDLQVEAADLSLSIDSAIPCGLIVTELVTNAIKHAFQNGWETVATDQPARLKQIRVRLYERDSQFVLEVCDNGVGLPPELDWQTTRSLGLRLVNRLSGQLHGQLELNSQNGAQFRLTFPKPT